MRCPKEKEIELNKGELIDGLPAHCCHSCQGNWLAAADYQRWQAMNAGLEVIPEPVVPMTLETDYEPTPLDGKAGLCPECGTYLKRSRINLKKVSFYVERCPVCEGFWCDKGEWGILEALGLHVQIPIVFNPDWQAQVRVGEQAERQKLAVIEKLGPELAKCVFDLGDLLTQHPQGDFAVAYLMRRFEK